MKKIFVGMMALLMLCACGSGKKETQTVCKGTIEDVETTMTLGFDGDEKLKNMEMLMSIDLGSAEVAELAKSSFEAQKDEMLKSFGGAGDITATVNGTAIDLTIVIDVDKASENQLGVDFDTTKDEIIKSIESDGFTCK